ncbi:hypothetical protein Hamer_G021797 [Homarus americanus]|uniref:Uncharacterized protein n=1 Tax=Homarus americanus TaxID=6706 RepID=A0A8J5K2K9_HOMAM|nr:hypothetical protein Hamer_G021797 [Homarus americanus]
MSPSQQNTMKVWLMLGVVVLVGVGRSEGSLEAWGQGQDLPQEAQDSATSGFSISPGTVHQDVHSSVSPDVSSYSSTNLQTSSYYTDLTEPLQNPVNQLGHSRRGRSGSGSLGEEEPDNDLTRAFREDGKDAWTTFMLFQKVATALGRWSLLEYLPEGVEEVVDVARICLTSPQRRTIDLRAFENLDPGV